MKKSSKSDSGIGLSAKISIITVIVIVWIICLALILTRCENIKKTDTNNPSPDSETAVTDTKDYNYSASGKVSNADSKTVAYFNSHYQGDYRTITEYIVTDNSGQQYAQTEKISWSSQGYKYKEVIMDKYSEDAGTENSIIYIYTPEKKYMLYPNTRTYFEYPNDMKDYSASITFDNSEFETGTINIRGKDYYCESYSDPQDGDTKYCFDDDGNLIYSVSTMSNGEVFTSYIEYSEDVDYSLFKVPADYTLEETPNTSE